KRHGRGSRQPAPRGNGWPWPIGCEPGASGAGFCSLSRPGFDLSYLQLTGIAAAFAVDQGTSESFYFLLAFFQQKRTLPEDFAGGAVASARDLLVNETLRSADCCAGIAIDADRSYWIPIFPAVLQNHHDTLVDEGTQLGVFAAAFRYHRRQLRPECRGIDAL